MWMVRSVVIVQVYYFQWVALVSSLEPVSLGGSHHTVFIWLHVMTAQVDYVSCLIVSVGSTFSDHNKFGDNKYRNALHRRIGDGEARGSICPSLLPKNREKVFFGQMSCKIRELRQFFVHNFPAKMPCVSKSWRLCRNVIVIGDELSFLFIEDLVYPTQTTLPLKEPEPPPPDDTMTCRANLPRSSRSADDLKYVLIINDLATT